MVSRLATLPSEGRSVSLLATSQAMIEGLPLVVAEA